MGHTIDISKGSAYDEILNDDYALAKFYSEKIEVLTLLGHGNRKFTKVEKEIERLNKVNEGLNATIEGLKGDMDDLTTNMNKMWNFIKRGKKLEEDKEKLDGYKIP